MRAAAEIVPENEQERFVHSFDLREIDAPNPTSFWRLMYVWRLRQTAALIRRAVPQGSRILEIGCAQGNLSITLAESGHKVTAVDSQPGFISYARKKDDRGLVQWIVGDAFELEKRERFTAVVMAEIIEHVTAPAELVRRALALLEPGGLLILTTPNGHCVTNTLPSFETVRSETGGFAGITIGPAGEDHIFAFRIGEMRDIIHESGGAIAALRWTGSVMLNSHVQWLLDIPVAGGLYFAAVRVISRIPLLNRMVAPTLVLCVRAAC